MGSSFTVEVKFGPEDLKQKPTNSIGTLVITLKDYSAEDFNDNWEFKIQDSQAIANDLKPMTLEEAIFRLTIQINREIRSAAQNEWNRVFAEDSDTVDSETRKSQADQARRVYLVSMERHTTSEELFFRPLADAFVREIVSIKRKLDNVIR